jgi:hypothetical protein
VQKRQYILLGLGMLLGTAAIGVTAARRTLQAQEDESQARTEEEAANVETPLAEPAAISGGVITRSEKLGAFQLRVRGEHSAALFDERGDVVARADGFEGARLLEGVRLYDAEAVELDGKTCHAPCNPTVQVVTMRSGRPLVVMRAAGEVKLDDLDRDGVAEALVDHLMEATKEEIITLPYRLEGARFVAAYARFPDGVDRQLDALSKSAENVCTAEVDEECQATLRAIVGLGAFRTPASPAEAIGRLRLEPAAKRWAREPERVRQIAEEIATVVTAS